MSTPSQNAGMAQTRSDSPAQWWGSFVIARSSVTRWQIGPLTLSAQRLAGEWRLGYESADDPLNDTAKRVPNLNAATLDEMAAVERFAISGESEEVRLEPRPADRPIVSRPDRPFHVLPGEEVTLYVGSPLWVAVSSVSPEKALMEIPTHRPSDTWFGPPTADGELCYASRTFCRLVLDDVPRRPHRAVTAVLIRNPSKEPLPILRLKLPMEQLGLFAAGDGRVWTHDVIFERGEGTEFAQLQIGESAPRAAKDAKALLAPRVRSVGNPVVRAFGSLFS